MSNNFTLRWINITVDFGFILQFDDKSGFKLSENINFVTELQQK